MDLNHITLPASLIADIYKNHLIESDQPALPATTPVNVNKKKPIQFLGKNQKGICLLVNYKNDVYLPDNELNFLTSILQACKLNLGDVAIINCYQQKISFTELTDEIHCKCMLIFGVEAESIGLNKAALFIAETINNCSIIYSPSAEQLNDNSAESKVLKSKLWICLKQLFSI
ncbi:MAG: hypothetical protein ABJB86_01545 [Bacteroidota bacterium]